MRTLRPFQRRCYRVGWLLVPKVGLRVLKTAIAITLSIWTARALHLVSPQFAGIVSVLAVQPSIYRSVRQGFQQLLSALIGALAAIACLYVLGRSALVIGALAMLLMGLHVRWRWTSSLLVAVVIAINTMGTQGMSFLDGGLNQVALVVIGIGWGTLVNVLIAAPHSRRAESLLSDCEQNVWRLLQMIHRDLQRGVVTPYPQFRQSIDQVRAALDEGKRIAQYVQEDQHYRSSTVVDVLSAFDTLESMVERLRDVNKTMQRQDAHLHQSDLTRLVNLLVRIQHRRLHGRSCHYSFLDAVFHSWESLYFERPARLRLHDFVGRATEYHLYLHLKEYYVKLKNLHNIAILSATSPRATSLS
jgi:uncharacterized membrane protein YgaE (UPF0421/DUF939 family)